MLADELDFVVGVDPHRDTHALAVVDVRTGGVVVEATTVADGEGYACVLRLADQHARGRRAFAVEGTGSFGAGLTRFSSGVRSGCSRSAGCDGSGSPARATRSTRGAGGGRALPVARVACVGARASACGPPLAEPGALAGQRRRSGSRWDPHRRGRCCRRALCRVLCASGGTHRRGRTWWADPALVLDTRARGGRAAAELLPARPWAVPAQGRRSTRADLAGRRRGPTEPVPTPARRGARQGSRASATLDARRRCRGRCRRCGSRSLSSR